MMKSAWRWVTSPYTFKTVIRNRSRHHIDTIWENAQDLEHLAVLHGRTNADFELLDASAPQRPGTYYDSLLFRARRKLFGVIPVTNFGFRRIVGRREIWQLDVSPLLNVTSALRSTLERAPDNPDETILVDYLEVRMPGIFRPVAPLMERALRRHAAIQCAEDEDFRARREELASRGVHLRASFLDKPLWNELFDKHTARVDEP